MIRKILFVPSWYPIQESPAMGSFCKEQAELIKDQFDLRILYPTIQVISKKKTLKRIFKPNGFNIRKNLLGEVPGVEIDTMITSFLSVQGQIDFLSACCKQYLQSLIDGGWEPELIHAHGTIYGGVVAAALAKAFKIPLIITEHQSLLVSNFDQQRWHLYKQAMESASLIIAVSNELRKMILMNGIRNKVVVAGNLVDEDLFFKRTSTANSKPFNILFIAVPAFTKDIPTFIRSLGLVKKKGFTDFRATILIPEIKANFTRQDIIEICQENGVMEHCIFMGSIHHSEMPELMNSCDVLISTSITETFGLSVAEALICGKPVIVTRSGGVEDFVNEDNGVLVNIGDHEAISEAIIQLMNRKLNFNPDTLREDMISRFGKRAFTEKICGIYNSLFNSLAPHNKGNESIFVLRKQTS